MKKESKRVEAAEMKALKKGGASKQLIVMEQQEARQETNALANGGVVVRAKAKLHGSC